MSKDWEEDFDRRYGWVFDPTVSKAIKTFIRKQRTQLLKEVIEQLTYGWPTYTEEAKHIKEEQLRKLKELEEAR